MSEYTPEETARNRAEWVAALRSGEFPQTKGVLRNERGFCCLGVSSELCAHANVVIYVEHSFNQSVRHSYNDDTAGLTPEVAKWLGLQPNDGDGELREPVRWLDPDGAPRGSATLMSLNDVAGYTFDEIADVIESGNLVLADAPSLTTSGSEGH